MTWEQEGERVGEEEDGGEFVGAREGGTVNEMDRELPSPAYPLPPTHPRLKCISTRSLFPPKRFHFPSHIQTTAPRTDKRVRSDLGERLLSENFSNESRFSGVRLVFCMLLTVAKPSTVQNLLLDHFFFFFVRMK